MQDSSTSSEKTERAFWDYLDELVEFRDACGHIKVPEDTHKDLYDWISLQKTKYNSDTLPLMEVLKLESVGIVFDPKSHLSPRTTVETESDTSDSFPGRIKELKEYEYDSSDLKSNPSLFKWASKQKKRFQEGNLTVAEEQELENAGIKLGNAKKKRSKFSLQFKERNRSIQFESKTSQRQCLDDDFAPRIKELKEFKELHGHCNVLKATNESLYSWVIQQQERYSENKLSRNEKAQLKRIGLTLRQAGKELRRKKKRFSFSDRIAQLAAYKEKNGHIKVHFRENFNLYQWIHFQKSSFKKGHLGPEEREQLDSVGLMDQFESERRSDVSFGEGNDDRNHVSEGKDENNVLIQNEEELQVDNEGEPSGKHLLRQDFLDSIEKLLQFKDSGEDHKLDSVRDEVYEWAQEQQMRHKDGTLLRAEEEMLSSIGFNFSANVVPNVSEAISSETKNGDFSEMLENFIALKRKDGDIDITENSNKVMYDWICEQKMRHRNKLLSASEVKGLQEAGILQRVGRPSMFPDKFKELQAFVQEHGHCNIPSNKKHLSRWVQRQTEKRMKGLLTKPEEEKLASLGLFEGGETQSGEVNEIVDKPPSERKKRGAPNMFAAKFKELQAFVQEHGHCNVPFKAGCILYQWIQR